MKIRKFLGLSTGAALVAIAGSLLLPIYPSHADNQITCPDGTYLNINLHSGASCVPITQPPTTPVADPAPTSTTAPAVTSAVAPITPPTSCQP